MMEAPLSDETCIEPDIGPHHENLESKADLSDVKDFTQKAESKKKKKGGTYCIVPTCRARIGSVYGIRGFNFSKQDPRMADLWSEGIQKTNKDGTPWHYSQDIGARVCSRHFISGRKIQNQHDIDFIPTAFKTGKTSDSYRVVAVSKCPKMGWHYSKKKPEDYLSARRVISNTWNSCFQDLKIICKGSVALQCHRAVISCASAFLKDLLIDCDPESAILMLIDYGVETVKYFLQRCYCVDSPSDHGLSKQQMEDLKDLLDTLKVENVPCEPMRQSARISKRKQELSEPAQMDGEGTKRPVLGIVSHSPCWRCQDFENNKETIQKEAQVSIAVPNGKKEPNLGSADDDLNELFGRLGGENDLSMKYEAVDDPLMDVDSTHDLLKTYDLGKMKSFLKPMDPPKEKLPKEMKTFVSPSTKLDDKEVSFKCATCDNYVKTTERAHNVLLTKLCSMQGVSNGKTFITYQCSTCRNLKKTLPADKKVPKPSLIPLSTSGWLPRFPKPKSSKPKPKSSKPAKGNLSDHVAEKASESLLCHECGKDFTSHYNLSRHMSAHKKENSHCCTECDKKFSNNYMLLKHMRKNHIDGQDAKLTVCSLCPELVPNSDNEVQDHLKRHHDENMAVTCDYCSYRCVNQLVLRDHINNYHKYLNSRGPGGKLQCPHCPALINRRTMNNHIKFRHNPKIPHQCSFCDFRSVTKQGVETHEAHHHFEMINKKPRIQCENNCGASFTQIPYMRRHMKRYCDKSELKEDMAKREKMLRKTGKLKPKRQEKERIKLFKQYLNE